MAVEGTNEVTGDVDEEGMKEDDLEVMAAIYDEDDVICGPCEPTGDELEEVQPAAQESQKSPCSIRAGNLRTPDPSWAIPELVRCVCVWSWQRHASLEKKCISC